MKFLSSNLFELPAFFLILMASWNGVGTEQPVPTSVFGKGIVVEWVTKKGEADRAGLQPGDILLSWVGPTSKGEIESPFDLPFIGFEQAPRGAVKMEGIRRGRKHIWVLHSIPFGIASHPNIGEPLLSSYQKAEELAHSGRLTEAIDIWRASARMAEASGEFWLSSWFLSHGGEALFRAKQMAVSDDLYREAIQSAANSGPIVRGDLFRQWASQLEAREDFVNAEKYRREELREWTQLGAELLIAKSLNGLGELLLNNGDFTEAETDFLKSLSIIEKLAPAAIQTVTSYLDLAVLYQDKGDLGKAERLYRKVVGIGRKHFPETEYLATILSDVGILARWRAKLAEAEEYQREALIIAQKRNLPLTIAMILDNIADCRLDRGDLRGAEAYQKRALAIREQSAASLPTAVSLASLGKIARLEGNLSAAQEYYRKALELAEKLTPPPPERASFLAGLADVARDRESFNEAEQGYREALAAIYQLTPRSLDHAETVASLAATLRRQGRLKEAAELYRQTLADLEYQTASLGVEETQARYWAKHAAYYREFIDVLIEERQDNLAFETLESSRARTLLEMLRLAQVDIREGAAPALLARERELRQSMNAKSQYRIRLLNEKHGDEQLDGLDREISDLRERYQQTEADIRASSPKYAALTQPQPLNLKEIQGLLDTATVVLEYSLGEKRSYVWVVGVDSLEMHELPGRAVIEPVARQLYRALTARTRKVSPDPNLEVAQWSKQDAFAQTLGMRLSRMVLTPVSTLIRGKRLLIVTDGALAYVPFSALPAPEDPNVPLLDKHEIISLPSASVLGEIRRATMNRPRSAREVAVLADPVFDAKDERVTGSANGSAAQPEASPQNQPVRRAGVVSRGGFYLERLIYSRDEAEAIRSLTSRSKTFVALDFDANRTTAMSRELARYRIVHFATHGLLDSSHPELSGLVLSLVDRQGKPQEGFLTLEDIYNLKLPADLVVLSSCQTALGENISGEGLMGLTRGFMYAGASRVLATLWSVDDYTTSELMVDFYRAMEVEKLRPAAALRKAQLEIWKHTGWHAPYYWAAFELQGEWK